MSVFHRKKKFIDEHDMVVLYESPRHVRILKMRKGSAFESKDGIFRHDDMIGKRYGSKIYTHNDRAAGFALHITPELWTSLLPHRTQILYSTDISVVIFTLGLVPGSRIVESGTGSGSMTHSLSRTVGSRGKVFTFEYHSERAEKAKCEFAEHGLSNVTVCHRDVCSQGFSVEEEKIDGTIDSVFLDLPEPWRAISHAVTLYDPNKVGKICCYSPCIEQVQKTCESLYTNGFTDIKMFECLERLKDSFEVEYKDIKELIYADSDKAGTFATTKVLQTQHPSSMTKGHTAFLTFASYLPAIVP